MRLLCVDLETTGLSPETDHITEVAWALKEVGDPKPLDLQSHFILPPSDLFELNPTITQLTKIQMKHLKRGKPLEDVFRWLADAAREADWIVGHNSENFDKPFLQEKSKGFDPSQRTSVFSKPWLDTMSDCVYPEDCRHTNLMYVAAYFGFVSPFPHAALFDVMTTLRILDQFDLAQVIERAKSPWCYVSANVGYENRQLAKDRRYSWETAGSRTYPKTWIKRIKEMEFEKERAEAPFQVTKLHD